ncbi:MAG TPA: UTP--glucose-1-phosphate uridylyltransferase [Solirubrobacteraceae bacterium]|nr:UTP--glucose-1-phosphate uridylyltransferase [Solirubrobacteraceae bacterium]
MSPMTLDGLRAAQDKMRQAGAHEEAIDAFAQAYQRVAEGEAALISSSEIEPAQAVPTLDELPDADASSALEQVVAIKLNGGLATTMGLRQPKSLVPAHRGLTFLDIIMGQTLASRRRFGVRLPLLLMNSQATHQATLDVLGRHPELDVGLPLHFMQSMIPKLEEGRMAPVRWSADPALEWCPPGHGDIYGALRRSGALSRLLEEGFRFAMVSNSDNLGARIDARIAAFVAAEEIPFLMEVIEGSPAERKGGHIARRRSDGQLLLREIAQTPPEEADSFRDYRHWRYYNANTIWLDLRRLSELLESRQGVMELPLIVNRKTVDPRDPNSTPVIQLETAMGAAIQSFPGARLLCVPRSRFVPVKTTNDLLVIRSDVYRLDDDFVVDPAPERAGRLPFVALDGRFYGMLDQFDARFPSGPPSLLEAESLAVEGDVTFGADVVVRGAVELRTAEPISLPDGSVLTG